MKPLKNAFKGVRSSPDFKKLMTEDGYLYLPNILNQDKIKELRDKVKEVYHVNGIDFDKISTEEITQEKVQNSRLDILKAVHQLPEFHQIARDEALTKILQTLLQNDLLIHPRKFCRATFPAFLGFPQRTDAHQDHLYVQGSPDTFTVWIPLGNYDAKDGVLRILERSHHNGLVPLRENEESNLNLCSNVSQYDPNWRAGNMRMGDALIFHSLTVHEGMENRLNEPRISIDFRFQSKEAFFAEQNLHAPFLVDEGMDSSNPVEWSYDIQVELPLPELIVSQVDYKEFQISKNSNFTPT